MKLARAWGPATARLGLPTLARPAPQRIPEDLPKRMGSVAMSNHWGSHLLNDTLKLLERRGVFEQTGRATAQELVLELVKLATQRYDCNASEILDQAGEQLGICYYCLTVSTDFKDGICGACRARHGRDDDDESFDPQ
jgi:hypothetical protein